MGEPLGGRDLPAIMNCEQPGNGRTASFARRFAESGTKSNRVLLVDDHELFRQVLAVVLQRHTDLDKNLQAGSLAEARRILTSHNGNEFVLAVIDLDLPDGDGFELVGELRRAEIPVLALTVSRDPERRAQALGAGAGEVLTTAASGDEILGVVERLKRG